MIETTPLENWIMKKIKQETAERDRALLDNYQLDKFRQNISYVKKNSPFYQELLRNVYPEDIKSFDDIGQIPFTRPDDLKIQGHKMVCVSQDEISRIVTLDTSGTTDKPKRVYFTPDDQELTIDFFDSGMSTFTRKGDKVLILMPGIRPGSIGDLLKTGLERMGAEGIIYGIVDDAAKVEQMITQEKINFIVGIPQQVFALANLPGAKMIKQQGHLHGVLLSTDYVPDAVVKRISDSWGCVVYEHYGLTEMGLGGGVFCKALTGYHLREADMLFEIIDPQTGKVLSEGEYGEVVFSTLTRKGMPLIRYRTGDISRFIKEPCSCGTFLKTMDKIQYRAASAVTLTSGYVLTMSELEEIIFAIPGLIDFEANVTNMEGIDFLNIYINTCFGSNDLFSSVVSAVQNSVLGNLIRSKKLNLLVDKLHGKEYDIKAIKKRKILDKRVGG